MKPTLKNITLSVALCLCPVFVTASVEYKKLQEHKIENQLVSEQFDRALKAMNVTKCSSKESDGIHICTIPDGDVLEAYIDYLK